VLSVAYHGTDRSVSTAFVEGLSFLGRERGGKYYEYGYNMSSRAVCEILEAIVATTHWPVYSPMAKEHFGKGRAEGLLEGARDVVLMVLKARGLEPSENEHGRVTDCTDLDQLRKWADAALTASTTRDVFG